MPEINNAIENFTTEKVGAFGKLMQFFKLYERQFLLAFCIACSYTVYLVMNSQLQRMEEQSNKKDMQITALRAENKEIYIKLLEKNNIIDKTPIVFDINRIDSLSKKNLKK